MVRTPPHQGADMDQVGFQEASLVCHLALSTAMFPSERSKTRVSFRLTISDFLEDKVNKKYERSMIIG